MKEKDRIIQEKLKRLEQDRKEKEQMQEELKRRDRQRKPPIISGEY